MSKPTTSTKPKATTRKPRTKPATKAATAAKPPQPAAPGFVNLCVGAITLTLCGSLSYIAYAIGSYILVRVYQ